MNSDNYGLVDCHSDKRYFSEVRSIGDGKSEVTLVNGKTMIVDDEDILRRPKPTDSVSAAQKDPDQEIVLHKEAQLPATIDELHDFVLVGEQKLKAHKALIAAIRKVPEAHAAEEAALEDAQGLAEVVIMAKAKLGSLLAATVRPRGERKKGGSSQRTTLPSLPAGITKKESHEAQLVAKHSALAKEVIARAKEEHRIPTPHEVYKRIRGNGAINGRVKPSTRAQKKSDVAVHGELGYLKALDKCLAALPEKPPKKWSEDHLQEAEAKARILIKRLSVFAAAMACKCALTGAEKCHGGAKQEHVQG
jgi:hypothetical protein